MKLGEINERRGTIGKQGTNQSDKTIVIVNSVNYNRSGYHGDTDGLENLSNYKILRRRVETTTSRLANNEDLR